jgi:hypothetical protein
MIMPISSHLLERAYQLINANQMQNAELVLDAVVRVDPKNIEAWIAYLEVHQDRSDLEWLKDRIVRTREISDQDKNELLQYHAVLIEHLKKVEAGTAHAHTVQSFSFRQINDLAARNEKISFELLDVFDYPSARNEPIAQKPARRNRRWYGINLHSPVNQAVALLVIFCAAVRLFISGYFLGYVLLAFFLFGCFYWLSNYKSQGSIPFKQPARMYFMDGKNKLTLTDKVTRRKSKTVKTPKP